MPREGRGHGSGGIGVRYLSRNALAFLKLASIRLMLRGSVQIEDLPCQSARKVDPTKSFVRRAGSMFSRAACRRLRRSAAGRSFARCLRRPSVPRLAARTGTQLDVECPSPTTRVGWLQSRHQGEMATVIREGHKDQLGASSRLRVASRG